MKTVKKMIEIIEYAGISVYNYEENGKLCGYELNTYTPAGVNEIIFLDFRNFEGKNKSAKNANDFINEFKSYMQGRPIDERIDLNRQNEDYKRDFTLSQSLKDFKSWGKDINKLIYKLENEK